MIALDTSILLRHLTGDDQEQARLADCLIAEQLSPVAPGFISIAVLLETIWVLSRGHGYAPEQVDRVVEAMLLAPQLRIADAGPVGRALKTGGPAGLADRIVHELGRQAGCTETVTFDRRFARMPGVRLLAD